LHSYISRPLEVSVLGCTRESTYSIAIRFPVALPEGPHPFPSRTRKLSPPGPMVLCWQRHGRVGRCRVNSVKGADLAPFVFLATGGQGGEPLAASVSECSEERQDESDYWCDD